MLLAFTDYYGVIYPFTALREVYYEKGSSYIHIHYIGITESISIRYSSVEDALNAYNQYIQYLTVPNPSSSPI